MFHAGKVASAFVKGYLYISCGMFVVGFVVTLAFELWGN